MSWFELIGKDLISTKDWSREELDIALEVAADFKRKHYTRQNLLGVLPGKSFFMLFFNDSTRTRHSFESAMTQLGGHAQYVRPENMRLSLEPDPTGKGESIKDTAEVLSRLGEGLGIRLMAGAVRGFGEGTAIVKEFARHASIPVINMASDLWHPCQGLTDLLTMREKMREVEGKKLVVTWAYSPHARDWCSAEETAMLAARYGMKVTIAHPPGYDLVPECIELARAYATQSGEKLEIVNDFDEALAGADVVYPRNWVTLDYHELGKAEENRLALEHRHWRFTREKRDRLTRKAALLHCMPIDRNNEADSDLIDDPDVSWLYDEAENRLHVQKAILALIMGGRI